MEINKYEVENKENEVVTCVKSDVYQTGKYYPSSYYKEIDYL